MASMSPIESDHFTAALCRAKAKECLSLAEQSVLQSQRIMLHLRLGAELPTVFRPTMHRYSIGQVVYFEGALQYNAARGQYKIVRLVPVERDNKVVYRIKSSAEAF